MNNPQESHVDQHVLKKYTIEDKLGKGAYGVVWRAQEKKTKKQVAVKKIFDAFANDTDAQRTYREVIILQQLAHPNIIRILNVLPADNAKDLYLVFEFMEADLAAVIRANILTPTHKQFVVYQTCCALKFVHSANLVHRDLKPSNLLLDSDCFVKLCDFGLSRSLNAPSEEQAVMTDYVATRWYRAPEILLGADHYSTAVDMWAVGCILAELILSKPVFPGASTMNQLERILELIGTPSGSDLASIKSNYAETIIKGMGQTYEPSWQRSFPDSPPEEIDILSKLFRFNPHTRMTVDEALAHPYLAQFHDSSKVKEFQGTLVFDINDNTRATKEDYRNHLYNLSSKRPKSGKPVDPKPVKPADPPKPVKPADPPKPAKPAEAPKPAKSADAPKAGSSSSAVVGQRPVGYSVPAAHTDDDEFSSSARDSAVSYGGSPVLNRPPSVRSNYNSPDSYRSETGDANDPRYNVTPCSDLLVALSTIATVRELNSHVSLHDSMLEKALTATQPEFDAAAAVAVELNERGDAQVSPYSFAAYAPFAKCVFVPRKSGSPGCLAACVGAAVLFGGEAVLTEPATPEAIKAFNFSQVQLPENASAKLKANPSPKVVLVDHQLVDHHADVNPKRIVGIIDRHAGTPNSLLTASPIDITVRPWASSASIVAHLFLENHRKLPREIAVLLLCGILSDTMNLEVPITTDWDVKMVSWLAAIGQVKDVPQLAHDLITARLSSVAGLSVHALVTGTLKVYEMSSEQFTGRVGITILPTSQPEALLPKQDALVEEMGYIKAERKLHMLLLVVVDLDKAVPSYDLVVCGPWEKDLAERAFGKKSNDVFMSLGKLKSEQDILASISACFQVKWAPPSKTQPSPPKKASRLIMDHSLGCVVRDATEYSEQAGKHKKKRSIFLGFLKPKGTPRD